jgi:5-methylcytosine-specific restriction protein A
MTQARPYIEAAGDLSGRAVEEWVGKSADTPAPPKVRLRVLLRYKRRCHRTGAVIRAGDAWDIDHVVALINGGQNREKNLAPILRGKPHVEKTAEDRDEADKVRRIREKHYGLKKSKTKWPKQKFNQWKRPA